MPARLRSREANALTVRLTDEEIGAFVREIKALPVDYRARTRTRPKQGHSERELDVEGTSGSSFRLILRQSLVNPLDFSVILVYSIPGTNQLFRLRRHNGKSHEHTNKLEGNTFYDFHEHYATERYQDSGFREDAYAEPTDRFADFEGAITWMIEDCGLSLPDAPQGSLL
jgi:hypothetical protein